MIADGDGSSPVMGKIEIFTVTFHTNVVFEKKKITENKKKEEEEKTCNTPPCW